MPKPTYIFIESKIHIRGLITLDLVSSFPYMIVLVKHVVQQEGEMVFLGKEVIHLRKLEYYY